MLSATPELRRDAAFSLVELLVVISLLGIAGTIVMITLNSGFRSTSLVQVETEASAELQRSVERISREVRVADPVEVAAAGQLQLRQFRDGVCSRVFYRLESGSLVQYTQTPLLPAPPAYGQPTDDTTCTTPAPGSVTGLPRTVLIKNLTAGTTVFRFYSNNGAQLVYPGALLRDLAQVEITLSRPGASGDAVSVSTRVDLRNKEVSPV